MNSNEDSKNLFSKLTRAPWFLGILIGFLAALLQALLISGGGPEAYGFCVACHTRDFINDVFNEITGQSLGLAPISKNAATAVLTMIGVMIGAFISAKYYKEFKLKKGTPRSYLLYFLGGIAVLVFALLLGGCPYRAALRAGYGGIVAIFGILAMAAGVFVGTKVVLWKMKQEAV